MLGAAQSDALGTELDRARRIGRRIDVGAHPQKAELVRPRHELLEMLAEPRFDQRRPARDYSPARAVHRNPIAFSHRATIDVEQTVLVVDVDLFAPGYTTLPHAAGHDRRVACHATPLGEDGHRGDHTMEVIRIGLSPDKDDGIAFAAALGGRVGVEHHLTHRRAGRGGEPRRQHLDLRFGIDGGVKQLVESIGVDAPHRITLRDQGIRGHLDGNAHGRLRRTLRGARLQHVQAPAFDRKLDILHVVEVLLQFLARLTQLLIRLRAQLSHLREGGGVPRPRDDILTLCVGEILPKEGVLPR